ncbi:agamous-like MADS-box protein AGL80 [Tanacetum coccineum]
MNDLKTLCGVDVCIVMYETPDAPAEVWPSHSEALRLIQEFEPELDQKASKDDKLAALVKELNELKILKAEVERQIKLSEEASEEKTRQN